MLSKKDFDDGTIGPFIQLISENTGWFIRSQDQLAVADKLSARMRTLKLKIDAYYELLKNPSSESDKEWQELACILTIPESYLFRDRGQFTLLEKTILPEIIERKKNLKTLRIWSAGCSTGEEAYSLAILIKKLIPNLKEWNIFILGTDINPLVIEKAKQGTYNSWSFRLVNSDLQKQYFKRVKSEWQLEQEIRNLVTFKWGNLTKDSFPNGNPEIHSMDLILCRNVFLYFEPKAISNVVEKFYKSLNVGGYFMSGHAELYGQDLGCFQAKLFPESIIYQRTEDKDISYSNISFIQFPIKENKEFRQDKNNLPVNILTTESVKLQEYTQEKNQTSTNLITSNGNKNNYFTASESILAEAKNFFKQKEYTEAIKKIHQLIACQPQNFDAHYLMAQVYANLGNYNDAIYYCQKAIDINPLSIYPYCLLIQIFEEKNDVDKAKKLLKKVIYLDSSSIFAYLELAFIYEQENELKKAKKLRTVALQLLEQLPPSAIIQPNNDISAGELLPKIKQMLTN